MMSIERSERIESPLPEQAKELIDDEAERLVHMTPLELKRHIDHLAESGTLEGYLRNVIKNPSALAYLSYWQKWFDKAVDHELERLVNERRRIDTGDDRGERARAKLPLDLEKRFSSDELMVVFGNTFAIQLCFGCSKGCAFCGLDAVPRVRGRFEFNELANLFERHGSALGMNTPLLYWASEPSDLPYYLDVHLLAELYGGYSPEVTTREVHNQNWLDSVEAISASNKRVSTHGLSEASRERLQERSSKTTLLDYQKGAPLQRGIGYSYLQYGNSSSPLGCCNINGVILSPRGLYNVVITRKEDRFPQGMAVIPFERFSSDAPHAGEALTDILRTSVVIARRGIQIDEKDKIYHFSIRRKEKTYDVEFDARTCLLTTVREVSYEDRVTRSTNHPYASTSEALDYSIRQARLHVLKRNLDFVRPISDLHKSLIFTAVDSVKPLEVIDVLIRYGYRPDEFSKNEDLELPMHRAVKKRLYDVAEKLFVAGASRTMVDAFGYYPVEYLDESAPVSLRKQLAVPDVSLGVPHEERVIRQAIAMLENNLHDPKRLDLMRRDYYRMIEFFRGVSLESFSSPDIRETYRTFLKFLSDVERRDQMHAEVAYYEETFGGIPDDVSIPPVYIDYPRGQGEKALYLAWMVMRDDHINLHDFR